MVSTVLWRHGSEATSPYSIHLQLRKSSEASENIIRFGGLLSQHGWRLLERSAKER